MIRRPPRSTLSSSSAASDVYKRQVVQHRGCLAGRGGGRPPTSLLSLIHISEPTRLLSISYAVFCLKKKKKPNTQNDLRFHQQNKKTINKKQKIPAYPTT